MKTANLRIYINEILSVFCPILDEILITNDNVSLTRDYRSSKIYLVEYLTRQSSNLNGLRAILKENTKIRNEHSLGLLTRNLLADLLYLYHLNFPELVIPNVDKNYFENEVLKLYADQLVRTLKGKESEVNDILKFDKFIQLTNGKIVSKYDKPILNKEIFEELNTKSETRQFSNIYNTWEIYSKYEHFGLLTNILQTRSNYELLVSHFKAITMVIHGIYIALKNIQSFGSEVKFSEVEIQKVASLLRELTEKSKIL